MLFMEMKNNLVTMSLSKSMMELGEFKTLSMEIKNKEILLSPFLIIQLGVTILIKIMMELGELMMLSSG